VLRPYVGFYWTLPVIREDFRYLPEDPDEAERKSRTIRYQRELARRYVKKFNGNLVEEFFFIDQRADRATERINEVLDRAREICDERRARLLYVNFSERDNWRPILGLREFLSRWGDDRAVALSPDRIFFNGEEFDPVAHFREWRERDGADMAELERAADKGLEDAMVQFPDKYRRWPKMAEWLNGRQIKSYNGLTWTPDNVRKAVERRKAEKAAQSD
jgi:hypothetical protein